jgi:hypothetical protein
MMPQMVQPFHPMQEAMATVTDTSQPPPNTNAMPTGNPLAMVPPFSLPRKSVYCDIGPGTIEFCQIKVFLNNLTGSIVYSTKF